MFIRTVKGQYLNADTFCFSSVKAHIFSQFLVTKRAAVNVISIVLACLSFTCPVSCWRIHGWPVAASRCRRVEPLDGRAPLFAVGPRLEEVCRLQTRLRVGSRRHVLEKRPQESERVNSKDADEWERQRKVSVLVQATGVFKCWIVKDMIFTKEKCFQMWMTACGLKMEWWFV